MPETNRPKLPIAVLISGGGTTLRNLLNRIDDGRLNAEVMLVLSSNPTAGGLAIAAQRSIPARVVRRNDHATPESFSKAVFEPCREAQIQLVVMGGFLKHVLIPADFENRVVNIHPGLIPAFCGKGYYGLRVHQAVLDYGVKVSGCTVHFVDNQYDHGPIIMQSTVPVLNDDTAELLQRRVFEQECEALPTVINRIANGQVEVVGRRVKVLDHV